MIYITHKVENTWMHGKMFKRSFLLENNIKFHPDLRVHEDTYFLSIAAECANKIGFLNIISYVWRWGKDSITRKNEGEYRFNNAIDFIKACAYAHDFIKTLPIEKQKNLEYKIV